MATGKNKGEKIEETEKTGENAVEETAIKARMQHIPSVVSNERPPMNNFLHNNIDGANARANISICKLNYDTKKFVTSWDEP